MTPIYVLLVDDHPLVLEGLKVLLEPLENLEIIGNVTTAAAALAAVRERCPDVVLLDINLPDRSGIEVCQELTRTYPGLKVLALTTITERSYITRMMQSGAAGYVLKNASPEELSEAILKVHAGRKFFSGDVQNLLLQPALEVPAGPVLTRREKEILSFIADGFTSQEIADKLFLSALTVESHRRNILVKFGASNTASVIRQAARLALI